MNYSCIEGEEVAPDDELECRACYQRFTVHSCKPKILDCLHRTCDRCLTKILPKGDGLPCVSCPFCYHETELHQVKGLPSDTNTMSMLILRTKRAWNSDYKVVLTPKTMASSSPSHRSSNCLVITIMEVQRDSPRTPSGSNASDYMPDHGTESVSLSSPGQLNQGLFSKLCKHVPRVLVWLLGLLYLHSLPLGIYLLVIQKVTLGVVCEFCSIHVSCMASASASAMEFVTALPEADMQCFINW